MIRTWTIVLIIACMAIVAISPATADDDQLDLVMVFYGPNWDINHDGKANYLDVSSLVNHYGDTGPPHWIRDDMAGSGGNPDGKVNYLDVSLLVNHYGDWWLWGH